MIRCLLVEDEPDSLNALKQEIALLKNPMIEIVGEADSMLAAIEAINTIKPNVVLLDIELGDGTGFDVLERVAYKEFSVIFITAYNQYAINAFKVNAIDYLLKPFPTKELVQAFEKVQVNSKDKSLENVNSLIGQFNIKSPKKISFSTSEGVSVYSADDIIRCESDNNYTCIFITNNEKLYIAKTLKDLEEELIKYGFERVHKSHLVNATHIKKYLNKDGGILQLSNGEFIPVSQRKKGDVIALLSN